MPVQSPLTNLISLPPEIVTALVPPEKVMSPLAVLDAFDLKKAPDPNPSKASASSPLPEPSTVLIRVSSVEAESLACGTVPDPKLLALSAVIFDPAP